MTKYYKCDQCGKMRLEKNLYGQTNYCLECIENFDPNIIEELGENQ